MILCTCRNSKLKEQAIQVLRDLLACHDNDSRYNNAECRASIASIYLPLLTVVMENYQHLYKGADGWEDWATTFERNSAVRRSVVIRDTVDGSSPEDVVSSFYIYFPELNILVNIIGSFNGRNIFGTTAWASFYTQLTNMLSVGFKEHGH